jgi:hypothetical protein
MLLERHKSISPHQNTTKRNPDLVLVKNFAGSDFIVEQLTELRSWMKATVTF